MGESETRQGTEEVREILELEKGVHPLTYIEILTVSVKEIPMLVSNSEIPLIQI